MTTEEYYTAPSDEIFKDIKKCSIAIWSTYDDTFKYSTEKIDRIKDLENIKDNAVYMISMFDMFNQLKLVSLVEPETRAWVMRFLHQSL